MNHLSHGTGGWLPLSFTGYRKDGRDAGWLESMLHRARAIAMRVRGSTAAAHEMPLAVVPGLGDDVRAVPQHNPELFPRTSAMLVSARGRPEARVKIALAPSSDEQVAVEADWLKRLEAVGALAGQVPRLLGEGTALNGRRYIMTTLAPQGSKSTDLSQAHLRFLSGLATVTTRNASFASSAYFQNLELTLGQLQLECEALEALQAATRDCWLALAAWSGPFVISHGDFAPWTVQQHQRSVFVTDWGDARMAANPLADVFHYLLAPRARARRPLTRRYLAKSLRTAQAAARQLHPGYWWDARVVSGLALAYLLDALMAHARARHAMDAGGVVVDTYWRLMEGRGQWMAP